MDKIKKIGGLAWLRQHKLVSALLVLILFGVGVWSYQVYAKHTNKVAFEQARVAIDTVYADIVAKVGQPDNYKRESECNQSYSGPYNLRISCSVDTDFIYAVKDKQGADSLAGKIRKIVENNPKLLHSTSAPKSDIYINPALGNPDINSSIAYYNAKGGLLCIFKYVYDTPGDTYLKLRSAAQEKTFYVTAGCTGSAKKMYYPPLLST